MKKTILILSLILFIFSACNTDEGKKNNSEEEKNVELYMSKEYKSAYEKGTRNIDGNPGENYFQNRADYQIKADFEPKTRTITGEEIVTYQNNSPDTLHKIIFHLYPDIYKKGVNRDWDIGTIDLHDGVNISDIQINNQNIDIQESTIRHGTILVVFLNNNLLPSSNIEIIINWNFHLPKKANIRHGTYNETTFFVAYWYPKIAVYDDLYGWDTYSYSGRQEFYHEYGDYEVEITVQDNYLVWSSGIFQNPEEILETEFLQKFNTAKTSNEVINIVTFEDRKNKQIVKSKGKNTWKFKAENLPDFAFALSDTYIWDGTSTEIEGERVFVHAIYPEFSVDFPKVAEISKQSIEILSETAIGYPFPYPQLTAFNGHGGMEFPMMINDGDTKDHNDCVFVTAHEIGHSYFPFFVGTNETTTSWLDEGLVTFLPKKVEKELAKDENFIPFKRVIESYNKYAGTHFDLPLITPATQLKGYSYRFLSYSKPAIAYYILRDYLGEEIFYKCIQEFIIRWNGKHPTGYDFFNTFNDVSGKNLNWFWEPWFFQYKYADLAIGELIEKNNKTEISINNIGGLPVPIKLTVIYANGEEKFIEHKADIWKNGKTSFYITIENKDIKELKLDTETIPDINFEDNLLELDKI